MNGGRVSGDAEVDAFVEVNLVSFPAWDLAVYLNRNSLSDSTLPELCAALARTEKDLVPALERSVATGLAEEYVDADGLTRYRLAKDDHLRGVLSRFCELASIREIRLEFVRTVMSRLTT
jgi:hypothetical protein